MSDARGIFCVVLAAVVALVQGTSFSGYEDYMNQWRLAAPQKSAKLFPYGIYFFDEERRSGFDPNIDFSLPFMDVTYPSIYVSIHGHITLSLTSTATEYPPWSGAWPHPSYPENDIKDPPFIAPYYSKTDTKASDPAEISRIYFRTLAKTDLSATKARINTDMLADMSRGVQEATLGADTFDATHGIIVTWDNMTFAGGVCNTNDCKRNTYQVALLTDGSSSHVIFNYYRLTWVGGTDQKCDPRTGMVSDDFPECRAAQAGFNAGNARGFHPLPYSLTPNILHLERGGSTVEGRFYFEVSSTRLVRGGCIEDTTQGELWGLNAYPSSDGMFGGREIKISGPCFTRSDAIKCRFGNIVTDGVSLNGIMHATCASPFQRAVGPMTIGVSTDGGTKYFFNGQFDTGHMAFSSRRITVNPSGADWLNPKSIDLRWPPSSLSAKSGAGVQILLHGYKESDSGLGEWTLIHTVADFATNTGQYVFQTADQQCGGLNVEVRCLSFDVGAFEIRLKDETTLITKSVNSDLIPLGWFIKTAMAARYGSSWAHDSCDRWVANDRKDSAWRHDLWRCPCTLAQALSDFGRYQPDESCNVYHQTSNQCDRHRGAIHCVLSVWANPSGAGTQCCYDEHGDLMYSGDTKEGSTPDKAHPYGSPPYGRSPRIPSLSHGLLDMTPYFYCCAYQEDDYDCFNNFIANRLTASCKEYQPAGHAAAFGDPHFRTFDGTVYTFNGAGEFWLMRADEVQKDGQTIQYELQGRLEPVMSTSTGRATQATKLSSVALTERGKVTVEARLADDHVFDKLEIFVDQKKVYFPNEETRIQFHTDVILINHDAADSQLRSNFTIILRSGFGIQVTYKSGLLHLIASVPPELKDHTFGLFGDWNGQTDDDLRPKDGSPAIAPEELERVHHQFGWTWAVPETASLFMYASKLTYTYYQDQTFLPSLVYPDGAQPGCDGNAQCAYDYVNWGDNRNNQVSQDTKNVQAWLAELAEMSRPVATCGWLDVLNSVKQQPISYSAGSVVTITSCRHGFKLEGPTRYECQADASGVYNWVPAITTKCIDTSAAKVMETKMAVAISIPAGIVFLLIIIAIIACCCCIRKKKRDKKLKEKELARADEPANDEFFSDFHDVKTKPSRPPRPSYRSPMVPNLSSSCADRGDTFGNLNSARSASREQLDIDDSFHTNSSHYYDQPDRAMALKYKVFPEECLDLSNTGRKPKRPPYQYPRNPETMEEKKRPPYRYPKSSTGLTDEEKAIIEMRARDFSFSDTDV